MSVICKPPTGPALPMLLDSSTAQVYPATPKRAAFEPRTPNNAYSKRRNFICPRQIFNSFLLLSFSYDSDDVCRRLPYADRWGQWLRPISIENTVCVPGILKSAVTTGHFFRSNFFCLP